MWRIVYLTKILIIFGYVNAQTRPVISHTFDEGVQFTNVAFHPTQALMVVGAKGKINLGVINKGAVYIWDLRTNSVVKKYETANATPLIAISPDGENLSVIDGASGEVELLNFSTGERIWKRTDYPQGVYGNCFLGDTELLTSGLDATVKLHELSTGEPQIVFNGRSGVYNGWVTLMDCDPNADTALLPGVSDFDRTLLLEYDIMNQKFLTGYKLGDTPIFVAYSPDFDYVAANTRVNGVRIWKRGEPTSIAMFDLQGQPGEGAVAFGPDGLFMFGDSLGNLNLTHLDDLSTVETVTPHSGLVFDIAVDPTGQFMATVGEDETLILWTFE